MAVSYHDSVMTVRSVLHKKDLPCADDPDKPMIHSVLPLEGQIAFVQLAIRFYIYGFNIYGYFPLRADPEDEKVMARISEFLHRANLGLRNGNFELDYRDGEIRFKTLVLTKEADELSEETVLEHIGFTGAMTTRYGPGLMRMIAGNCSPEEAVSRCEQDLWEGAEDEEMSFEERQARMAAERARRAPNRNAEDDEDHDNDPHDDDPYDDEEDGSDNHEGYENSDDDGYDDDSVSLIREEQRERFLERLQEELDRAMEAMTEEQRKKQTEQETEEEFPF